MQLNTNSGINREECRNILHLVTFRLSLIIIIVTVFNIIMKFIIMYMSNIVNFLDKKPPYPVGSILGIETTKPVYSKACNQTLNILGFGMHVAFI